MIDDRGVSVTLDYILMLSIAAIVLASVIFISGAVVDTQADRSVDAELTVSGERLAGEIEGAERLATSGSIEDTELVMRVELPRSLVGNAYTISVNESEVHMQTRDGDHESRIPINAKLIDGNEYELRGGPVEIVIRDGELVVQSA